MRDTSAESHFIRDGATIAYQYTGSGSPLGYAHGVFLSRDAVRRLGLFDFDLLGLLDAAGVDEPIDFAGSSYGVAAALRAAVTAPERFRRLVLLIPPVAWESGPDQARRWYTDTADRIDEIGPQAWRAEWAAADPLPIFADYPKFDFTPQIPDSLIAPILRGIGSSDLPAPSELAALRVPTLILTWDTDPLHPLATASRLRDLIPGAELVVAGEVADIQTWTSRTAAFVSP